MNLPQIEPVATLSKDYKALFAKLTKGPIFLAQHSKPAAVLLSIRDYEKMVNRLNRLDAIQEAKLALERIERGELKTISHDELMSLMLEKRAEYVGD
ncbi:MAG: type II toxin-antitoxin system prevent-host-death family antitoxin [Caldilineaceae bacterium]